MVLDNERIEDKIDRIFNEIKEQGKVIAVQEQKLREINHRMGDGQQRNVFAQELLKNEMTKRLDKIDHVLERKVDLDDYKDTLTELREALAKDRKMMMAISVILVTGSGLIANVEPIKKLLMFIFGMH